jgi:nucleotide-binding universal stress UspA family protein
LPEKESTMTTFATEWDIEQTAGTANSGPSVPVVAVVGFDGSAPARRALDGAARLLHGRDGKLEVVFVASVPSIAGLSTEATAALETSLDDSVKQLSEEVRTRLEGVETRWHFQRRDGRVAHELLAAADELRRWYGSDAKIVIVVGGSSHRYHRLFGSAALDVVRHDSYPVVVEP